MEPAMSGSGRTPPVKDVGKLCAGGSHAPFNGRGWKRSATAPARDPTNLPRTAERPAALQVHQIPLTFPGRHLRMVVVPLLILHLNVVMHKLRGKHLVDKRIIGKGVDGLK